MIRMRGQRDLWTGLIFVAFGAFGLAFGLGLPRGSAARMGAGYFPVAVSAVLLLVGAITIGRGFMREGEPVGALGWRPLLKIVLATAAFGLLLEPAGFAIAAVALVLLSASASDEFALAWRPLAGLALLVAVSALVFVKALGLPMPLTGTWWVSALPARLGF